MPLHDLWTETWGLPICNSAMSRNTFKFIQFEKRSERSERLRTDKFALFSTAWNRFNENCFAGYKLGPYVTIDEQLFPSKARCSFTQFIA